MIRIILHTACPDTKRAIAAQMDGLSGLPQEHAIPLASVAGGPSAAWDAEQGYSGQWWGASQRMEVTIASDMLASGYMLGTESWFVARWEEGGSLIDHNLPNPPENASFDAFLAAAGLERVES
jgi:hypothetical protein